MKTLIIVIGVLLYLLIGSRLFTAGVNLGGGKEWYYELLAKEHPTLNPDLVFFIVHIWVMIFWPYYLGKGFRDRRR